MYGGFVASHEKGSASATKGNWSMIENDLLIDARNRAIKFEGTHILMIGNAYGGEWEFKVYRCDN
jgi:hypothetical protein